MIYHSALLLGEWCQHFHLITLVMLPTHISATYLSSPLILMIHGAINQRKDSGYKTQPSRCTYAGGEVCVLTDEAFVRPVHRCVQFVGGSVKH